MINLFALLLIIWPPEPVEWYELPAILSVYDPLQCDKPGGEINCDSDPAHFATGIDVGPEWYGRAAACDPRLLGAVVTFEGIGSFMCIDTGAAIGERWSEYYQRPVMVFDLMVNLDEPPP